jgi:hypothetical protein
MKYLIATLVLIAAFYETVWADEKNNKMDAQAMEIIKFATFDYHTGRITDCSSKMSDIVFINCSILKLEKYDFEFTEEEINEIKHIKKRLK